MTKLQTLGIALCLSLCSVAVFTASASAAPEWLLDENTIGTAVPVEMEGELLLEEMLTGTAVRIEFTGTGSVGPNSHDLIESITVKKSFLAIHGACTVLLAVEAVDLPWSSTLVLEEPGGKNEYYDKITQDGKGLPGWLVECTSLIGKLDEVCVSTSVSPQVHNGDASPFRVELQYHNDALTAGTCSDESEALAGGESVTLEPKNKSLEVSG